MEDNKNTPNRLTSEEFLEAMNSTPEEKHPKNIVVFSLEMFDSKKNTSLPVLSKTLNKVFIRSHMHGEFVRLDITFQKVTDIDFKVLWNNIFEEFGNLIEKLYSDDLKENEIPNLTITVFPTAFDNRYFMLFQMPVMWTLQPQDPGKDVDTIVAYFKPKFVEICEASFDLDSFINEKKKVIKRERDFVREKMLANNSSYETSKIEQKAAGVGTGDLGMLMRGSHGMKYDDKEKEEGRRYY